MISTTEMDDRRVIARAGAGVAPDAQLGAFLGHVVHLAGVIGVAHRRIPPPGGMARLVPRFRDLATELGARLTIGDMSLRDGVFGGRRVDVETLFGNGGAPAGIAVTLHAATPLAHAFDARDDAAIAALPDDARELALLLRAEARSLRAAPDRLVVELGLRAAEPEELLRARSDLASLEARLRGARRLGPYR